MKFKINNMEWEIVEANQEEIKQEMKKHFDKPDEEGKYFGVTYLDTQKIFLDKDLHIQRKRNTLLHELAHCYIGSFITHLGNKQYIEEDIADILANSHDIIREIVDEYFVKEKNNENT